MKLLYVSNLYGANARGGAEKIVQREAEAMAAAGHDVTVVAACRKGEPGEDARGAGGGVRVLRHAPSNLYFYADDHRHGTFARLLWHVRDTFNTSSAAAFGELLRREMPDVIHTHNLMGLGFMIPAAIRAEIVRRRSRRLPPLRHVHTVHDVQLLHPSGLLSPRKGANGHETLPFAWLRPAYEFVMRRLMGSPDVVAFPSAFLSSLHLQKGFFPRSERVVLANPAPEVSAAAPKPSAPAFLFVGQIEVHKGIHVLVEAWEKAGLHRSRGATLTVVGDGTETGRLRARAATVGGVTVAGKLRGAELSAAYDAATYLVVPSIVIENQPTVILEAFSRGVPAIGAVSGGIPELVREGMTGFLFRPDDADACAAALRKAAGAGNWPEMSRAAADWARRHDMSHHASALMSLYEKKGSSVFLVAPRQNR